jgi:FkbM family methyltransferase
MLETLFRALPAFKGKRRLARLLFRSRIRKSRDLIVNGKFGVKYKLPNLIENVAFDIFVMGVYEPEYIRYLAKILPPDAVMLDLGANIGSIGIPVAKMRPDIKIVAVEASRHVFEYLRQNVQLNNCKNISLENFALSDKDNEQVAFYSPEEKFGKGSMSAVYTDKAEFATTITLDSIVAKYGFKKVDVIKIDVEGYEATVFKGGKNLLSAPDAPVVLFEYAHWAESLARNTLPGDSQKILFRYGYRLHELSNPNKPLLLDKPLGEGTFMMMADKPGNKH